MNTIAKEQADGSNFLDRLNGAIRENPVSAGAIGIGVLWMLLGNKTISSLAAPIASSASMLVDGARRTSEGASAVAAETSHKVGEAVRDASDSIKSNIATVANGAVAANPAPEIAHTAIEYGRGLGQSVQRNVAGTFDGQPLLLGAIGLGIGLGLASAFSSTKFEQDLVGPAAADLKDRFNELTQEAGKRAEKVFDDVKHEATEKGLTASNLSEGVSTLVQKVKTTTGAVTDSVHSSPGRNT